MEFAHLNDRDRLRRLGTEAPWDPSAGLSPELIKAGIARGRLARARAFQHALRGLGRALTRWSRRLLPRIPAGAHGPEAIDFDCAHGRPC